MFVRDDLIEIQLPQRWLEWRFLFFRGKICLQKSFTHNTTTRDLKMCYAECCSSAIQYGGRHKHTPDGSLENTTTEAYEWLWGLIRRLWPDRIFDCVTFFISVLPEQILPRQLLGSTAGRSSSLSPHRTRRDIWRFTRCLRWSGHHCSIYPILGDCSSCTGDGFRQGWFFVSIWKTWSTELEPLKDQIDLSHFTVPLDNRLDSWAWDDGRSYLSIRSFHHRKRPETGWDTSAKVSFTIV